MLILLALSAFGSVAGCSGEMIERLTLAIFLRNLKGTVGERVRERFVTTLDEAVVMARNYELAGVVESTKVNAIGGRRGNRFSSTSRDQSSSSTSGAGQSTNPDKDMTCFNCEKPGHRKINCWAEGGGSYKGNNTSNNNSGGRGGFRCRGRGGRGSGCGGSSNSINAVNGAVSGHAAQNK